MRYRPALAGSSNLAAYQPPVWLWRRVWRSANGSLERKIDGNARRRLVAIVLEYISGQQFEDGAEPISAALARIEELRKPAASLFDVLQIAPAGSEARHAAERLINESLLGSRYFVRQTFPGDQIGGGGLLSRLGEPPQLPFSSSLLSDFLGEFIAACHAAAAKLAAEGSDNYYAPGSAWNRFVWQLGCFYQTVTGQAPTAGKKESQVSGFNPSPFVQFVHVVQTDLPRNYWRHPKAAGLLPETAERHKRSAAGASMTLSDAVSKALTRATKQPRKR